MNKVYLVCAFYNYEADSKNFVGVHFLVKADIIGELIVDDDFIYPSDLKNIEVLDYEKKYSFKAFPLSNESFLQVIKTTSRLFLKEELKEINDDKSAKLYFKLNYEE